MTKPVHSTTASQDTRQRAVTRPAAASIPHRDSPARKRPFPPRRDSGQAEMLASESPNAEMTAMKVKRKRSGFPMEKAAALEFEPWKREDVEGEPPTNESWCNPTLVMIRMAYHMMFQSKQELMASAWWKSENEEKDPLAVVTLKQYRECIEDLERAAALVKMAQARLIVAGAAAAFAGG